MKMKIIVCIKQVPEKNVKMDWKHGRLIREDSSNTLNPDDYHALELALQLRDRYGGEITAVTLGPPQAKDILREAYSFGVDNCVLITDPIFAGADTYATSKTLHRAIKKIGNFDIIVTGMKSSDGDTGHVSYQLSEFFKIPHITQIHTIEIEGKNAIIERIYGHEFQKVSVSLPIIIASSRTTNRVRYPKLKDIKYSFDKDIKTLTFRELGGIQEEYGQMGSPTITLEGELFHHKRKNEVFEGSIDEKVESLVSKLKKYNMLGS